MSNLSTSEEVLGAAERVFEEYGYRRASMQDVARAAGLSRAGLYKHFSSKSELFRAVLERLHGSTLQAAAAHAAASREDPLEARLAGLYAARQGALLERVGGRLHGEELLAAAARIGGDLNLRSRERFLRIVARVLREADAVGEIDLGFAGVSAPACADLVTRAVDGLKLRDADEPIDAKKFHDRVPGLLRLLVRGLAAGPGALPNH